MTTREQEQEQEQRQVQMQTQMQTQIPCGNDNQKSKSKSKSKSKGKCRCRRRCRRRFPAGMTTRRARARARAKAKAKAARCGRCPGGALGKVQAEYQFGLGDFRFTQGSDGAVYAFALGRPGKGERVVIRAMAKGVGSSGAGASEAGLLKAPVTSVRMLGSSRKVAWKQTAKGLEITVSASGLRGMPVAVRIQ